MTLFLSLKASLMFAAKGITTTVRKQWKMSAAGKIFAVHPMLDVQSCITGIIGNSTGTLLDIIISYLISYHIISYHINDFNN